MSKGSVLRNMVSVLLSFVSFLFFSSVSYMMTPVQARAEARTLLSFLDRCDQSVVQVSALRKLAVGVHIDGLPPFSTIRLTMMSGPEGYLGETVKSFNRRRWGKKLKADATGSVHLVRNVRIPKPERSMRGQPEGRMWQARVDWEQENPPHGIPNAGISFASVFLLGSESEKLYEVLDTKAIATWYTPVSIASDYKYNHTEGQMHVHRGDAWHTTYGALSHNEFGFSSVAMNSGKFDNSSGIAVRELGGRDGLFIFKGWRKIQRDTHQIFLQKHWSLQLKQGGVFGTRYKFERMKVQEYSFQTKGRQLGCGYWSKTRIGTLDVGTRLLDFYVLPDSYSSSAQKMEEFINQNYEPMERAQVSSEGVEEDESDSKILFNPKESA